MTYVFEMRLYGHILTKRVFRISTYLGTTAHFSQPLLTQWCQWFRCCEKQNLVNCKPHETTLRAPVVLHQFKAAL